MWKCLCKVDNSEKSSGKAEPRESRSPRLKAASYTAIPEPHTNPCLWSHFPTCGSHLCTNSLRTSSPCLSFDSGSEAISWLRSHPVPRLSWKRLLNLNMQNNPVEEERSVFGPREKESMRISHCELARLRTVSLILRSWG